MENDQRSSSAPGPKPGSRHTTFFEDEMSDHLLRALISVTMELSVLRERLDTVERVLVRNETMTLHDVEDDSLITDEIAKSRATGRQKLVEDVFGPLAEKLAGRP